MQPFRNILVGVDLSNVNPSAHIEITPPDEAALNCALVVARYAQAKLTVFSSLNAYPYLHDSVQTEFDHSRVEKEAKKILGHLQARAGDAGVESRTKLGFGAPWEEICREVLNEKHDLVIVGTRDLSRTDRFLFGSTGMKLLRNCPCPVWITRPGTDWRHPNILIPSDLSAVSLEALRVAVTCGEIVDARLHALHVLVGPGPPPPWYGREAQELYEQFTDERRIEATRQLEKQLLAADCNCLPNAVEIHVANGRPDETILRTIEDLRIDLVVMGTSARSGIQALTMGNTTERLISKMRCSLLAVKPIGLECPLPT